MENAFGIAASRFRVFRKPICANVETVVAITKAVIALHNFLMRSDKEKYCPPTFVDEEIDNGEIRKGLWREDVKEFNNALSNIKTMSSNNYSVLAKEVRDNFKDYFNSADGEVSWQNKYIDSTTNYFDEH